MIENRCLVLMVCIAILSIGCSKKEEIVHEGKPLSTWIEMLEGPDPLMRFAAINAVGKIGPEAREGIPALIEMIRQTRNSDKKMIVACNKALLAMGKEIVPHMISLLKDDDWEMRRGAAWTLGMLGPDAKDAIPVLTKALNEPNPNVRAMAAESLKKIKGEDTKPELRIPKKPHPK